MHNHSNNLPSTGSDLVAARKNKFGIVVCHNGNIYAYRTLNKGFTKELFDLTIEKYKNIGYDEGVAGEIALTQFKENGFIEWRKWGA